MFDLNTKIPAGYEAIGYTAPCKGDLYLDFNAFGEYVVDTALIDFGDRNYKLIVEKKPFMPLQGEYFFSVNAYFEVESIVFASSYSDKRLINAGNFLETEEQAAEAAEIFKKAVADVKLPR